MDWMSEIQDSITEHNHQLFMFAHKCASQGLFLGFYYNPFSYPLPELCLCGPEFFSVATNQTGGFFLLFLPPLIFLFQVLIHGSNVSVSLLTRMRPKHVARIWLMSQPPERGSLKREATSQIKKPILTNRKFISRRRPCILSCLSDGRRCLTSQTFAKCDFTVFAFGLNRVGSNPDAQRGVE